MDSTDFYNGCLQAATAVIRQTRPDLAANETPCSDWNVRDVAEHMLYELVWVPDMLAGLTVEEVGPKYDGDLIGEDFAMLPERWEAAARAAEEAIAGALPDSPVHMSYADTTVSGYLKQAGGDLLIHSWDLARGLGLPFSFPPAEATELYDRTLPRRGELAASGLFAPALTSSEGADLPTRLLALFGRDVNWRPA